MDLIHVADESGIVGIAVFMYLIWDSAMYIIYC